MAEEPFKLIKLNALFKCYNVDCPQAYEAAGTECMRCMLKHIWQDEKNFREIMKLVELKKHEVPDITLASIPDITPPEVPAVEDIEFLKRKDLGLMIGIREFKGESFDKAMKLINDEEKTKTDAKVLELKRDPPK